jgi:MYXO-CTERM domain-containing protein
MRRLTLLVLALTLLPSLATAQIVGEPTGNVLLRFEGLDEPSRALLDRIESDDRIDRLERLAGSWPTFAAKTSGGDPATIASELARLPEVRWAEPDVFLDLVPHALDDEYWDKLWHLENVGQTEGALPGADIHAVPAWSLTNGAGVQIAILDSGVDTDHPDLLVTGGVDVVSNDLDPNPSEDDSNPGHGTLVAGIAAAVGNNGIGVAGVAWGAEVWGVRMLGAGSTLQDTRDAFVLATDAGVSVLNNSWGMMAQDCSPVPSFSSLNDAIDYATTEGRGGLGAAVVFSAGNQGCEYIEYPMLARPGVIVVGSLTDQDQKFGYSSYGEYLDVMAPSGPVGGHSRPGMWSTDIFGDMGFNGAGENNEYSPWMGGTSGAAPVISGVVALMVSVNDRLRNEDIQRVLCETAVKVDPAGGAYDATGWSNLYGCGRVDAAAAVSAVANVAPSAPTLLAPLDGAVFEIDDVVLRWAPATDDDGELLAYEVELVPPDQAGDDDSGDDDDSAADDGLLHWDELVDPLLDLSGQLEPGGYTLTLWAHDAWGRGAASETVDFDVVEPEPEPVDDDDDGADCSCSSAPGGGAGALAIALLLGLALRRREG